MAVLWSLRPSAPAKTFTTLQVRVRINQKCMFFYIFGSRKINTLQKSFFEKYGIKKYKELIEKYEEIYFKSLNGTTYCKKKKM